MFGPLGEKDGDMTIQCGRKGLVGGGGRKKRRCQVLASERMDQPGNNPLFRERPWGMGAVKQGIENRPAGAMVLSITIKAWQNERPTVKAP